MTLKLNGREHELARSIKGGFVALKQIRENQENAHNTMRIAPFSDANEADHDRDETLRHLVR